MDAEIRHVSDTALMVAAARALESARPNGLINDPYAARLAGERGMAIVSAREQDWMRIGISVRTHFIDEFVHDAITEHGVRTVLDLGAGLDTRPWRMDLPSTLRWIEVDFEPVLDYKLNVLSHDQPKCIHQAISADLTSAEDRTRIHSTVGSDPALMITEGLLMYLPADVVRAFGTDFPQHTGIRLWLFDLASVAVMRMVHSQGLEQIEKVRAEDHLTGIEITNMVRRTGWRLLDYTSYVQAAAKFLAERMGPVPENLAGPEPPANDPSGVYLFAAD